MFHTGMPQVQSSTYVCSCLVLFQIPCNNNERTVFCLVAQHSFIKDLRQEEAQL